MKKASSPKQQLEKLKRVNTRLKSELEECRETLRAIQQGEVDALVVNDGDSHHVFTLKNADQPYRVFVETMNEGAATLSPDGLIYYCNQRFADLMGCALETVIGGTIQEHFKNSTLPDFKEIVKQGQTTKGNRIFVNYPSQSRTIPLQLSMSVVQLEETQGICVVVTDLSEQRRLEESKADVERLNIERGIRERFVSTLAHDLRTPLTAGLLASQLLMRKDFSGEDVKKIAKRIARNMDEPDSRG
jgi:PAS domain S-box-containing protein